jgi:hypothetical protein
VQQLEVAYIDGKLVPMNDDHNLKPSQIYVVNFKRVRNPRFHRKFFKMLKVVVDNMPEAYAIRFGDVDRLRKEILIQTGRYETHTTINGTEMIFPKSISFADMGGDEFESLYSDALRICSKYFLKCSEEQLDNFINDFL